VASAKSEAVPSRMAMRAAPMPRIWLVGKSWANSHGNLGTVPNGTRISISVSLCRGEW